MKCTNDNFIITLLFFIIYNQTKEFFFELVYIIFCVIYVIEFILCIIDRYKQNQ